MTRPMAARLLAVAGAIALAAAASARQAADWEPLFDGRTLGAWTSTEFGGEGPVGVRDGVIRLSMGDPLTGVTWAGPDLPRLDYEIEFEAARLAGADFFGTITFPVGDRHCSLVVGGWAGMTVGLSNLDGLDASENDTSRLMRFETGRWYRIRVRVTATRIDAWIDDEPVVDVETTGRRIGIRPEVAPSRPLGISSYRTTAGVRGIRLRRLNAAP